jgi:hypothetical protein
MRRAYLIATALMVTGPAFGGCLTPCPPGKTNFSFNLARDYDGTSEHRNYWAMTCTPEDGAPYKVESVSDSRVMTLIITSSHGHAHNYQVMKHTVFYPGFTITATDGKRVLEAYFSRDGGALTVLTTGETDACGKIR